MKRYSLSQYRKNNNLNQTEFADLIGISKSAYSRIENCKREGSIKVWDKLEQITGIPQQKLREIS